MGLMVSDRRASTLGGAFFLVCCCVAALLVSRTIKHDNPNANTLQPRPFGYQETNDLPPGTLMPDRTRELLSSLADEDRLLLVLAGGCSKCAVESFKRFPPPRAISGALVFEVSAQDVKHQGVERELKGKWDAFADPQSVVRADLVAA